MKLLRIIASMLYSQNIAKYNKNLDGGSVKCPSQCSLVSYCMDLSYRQRLFSFPTWAFFILVFVPLNFATPLYYVVSDSDKSIQVYAYAEALCDKKLSSFL